MSIGPGELARKKRFHCEIRLNTPRTASGAVRSISELRGDAKQLGNESGLGDCILFGHPSRSALPNHVLLYHIIQVLALTETNPTGKNTFFLQRLHGSR